MIRLATLEDVSALGAIGERFHREARLEGVAPYVREDCEQSIRQLIESPDGVVLVAEEGGEVIGVAGGMAHPFYFNHSHRTGGELFWWVDPKFPGVGMRLFKALETEARALGCESWAMIALEEIDPVRTGNLYRRRGYEPREHSYIKRF